MTSLPVLLDERREEVIGRWMSMVKGTLVPASLPAVELVDHLPLFLKEVIAALHLDAGDSSVTLTPEQTQTASDHGEQRLRLGFSLDAVVREYGALSDAIIDVARASGAEVSSRQLRVISSCTVHGIARAVVEYARQRDAELVRQHNEHFAFLAHELRNPLGTAVTALSLMVRRGAVDSEARDAAAMKRSLTRMQELIDHSLQIARVASGIELRRERVGLRALLADAELLVSGEAEAKSVALVVRLEQEIDAYVDVRLISSALSNLVRNAVKYSGAGTVEVRGKVIDGGISIEVEDCCGGLAPGQVEAAFAPFARLDRPEEGFGLGLSIAKQAVDAHGGQIRVQNLPAKGCMFVLDLPAATIRP